MRWTNWAGDQSCSPAEFCRPSTVDEVVSAISRATASDATVRVVGAGHSFTPAVLTDGTLISLERMNRVVEVDHDAGLVRVQAGITIHDLSRQLDEVGLALENLGDIDVQSIAGATATGTHGTGARLRNISDSIEAFQVVTGDGAVVEVSRDEDPDAWRAGRVNLGALGVITEMTLRTVPAFVLRGVDGPIGFERVLEELDERVASNDHFEFFVFPHSDTVQTRTNNRVEDDPRPRSAARAWVDHVLLETYAYGASRKVGRRIPKTIPALNRLAARAWGSSERIERSYEIFSSPRRVRFTEMEYALPRDVVRETITEVKRLAERDEYKVSFPIEVRFAAGDDALLSPAHERDAAYIAVHVYRGMPYDGYFRAVETVARSVGGRPHWGKRHFRTAEDLAPAYPEWDRFRSIRDRFDPQRRFANDYVRQVLGD